MRARPQVDMTSRISFFCKLFGQLGGLRTMDLPPTHMTISFSIIQGSTLLGTVGGGGGGGWVVVVVVSGAAVVVVVVVGGSR